MALTLGVSLSANDNTDEESIDRHSDENIIHFRESDLIKDKVGDIE